MGAIEKIVWSTICKVAGEHNQEGLILGASRDALREASHRVSEELRNPKIASKDLQKELQDCLDKLRQPMV